MSLISATDLGNFVQNDCVTLYQACDSCTFVNVTSVKQPNQTQILDQPMTNFGFDFTYEYCNTSQIGGYKYNVCGDKGGSIVCEVIDFTITSDGNKLSTPDSLVRIFLIIFFSVLLIVTHLIVRKVDFERWNNSIIEEYQQKNFVKMVLSALVFNIMKNVFIIYYLMGLPILMIVQNITYAYNITSLITFMNVLLLIYTVGIVIVGLVFLSYVQEWSMNMINLVREMDWGIKR